jgi:hypothetical protein
MNEYLHTLDELNEISAPPEDQDTSTWACSLRNRRRRSSAVSEIGVLSLE